MKSRISAMMDGELTQSEFEELLLATHTDGEALEAWRRYHLISDALRDTQILSSGFSARLSARLEAEPAILAPAALPARAAPASFWHGYRAVAAGVAAVAAVAFSTSQLLGPAEGPVAQAPASAPVAKAEAVLVTAPKEADEYLRAHQNYSPRNGLQGVAPYVRTVADTARQR